MLRRLGFALALLAGLSCTSPNAAFALTPAQRIVLLNGIGPQILDQVPGATAAYSLRCLRAAYCASGYAVNIRRASDQSQLAIGFVRTNLNIALVSSFCASTTCYVSTWYDQSGNGNNATQTTAASQPQLVLDATPSGEPTVSFNGSVYFRISATLNLPQPWTASWIGERTGNISNYGYVFGKNTTGTVPSVGYANSANKVYISATSAVTVAASDSAFHVVQGVLNGASSTMGVDGNYTGSLNPGTTAFNGVASIGYLGAQSTNPLAGNISEIIVYPTAANLPALVANQSTWAGTP